MDGTINSVYVILANSQRTIFYFYKLNPSTLLFEPDGTLTPPTPCSKIQEVKVGKRTFLVAMNSDNANIVYVYDENRNIVDQKSLAIRMRLLINNCFIVEDDILYYTPQLVDINGNLINSFTMIVDKVAGADLQINFSHNKAWVSQGGYNNNGLLRSFDFDTKYFDKRNVGNSSYWAPMPYVIELK